jgi:hypothetical protein
MAYEQRDLSGSIFVNDRKEKDSHPDFNGQCLIDGKAFWVSGWKKKTGAGKTWLSLSFKPKDAAPKDAPADDGFGDDTPQSQGSAPRKAAPKDDFDDSIPF